MNCGFIDTGEQGERLLLLGHTDGTTATAGGLGVLTTHTQTGGERDNQYRTPASTHPTLQETLKVQH